MAQDYIAIADSWLAGDFDEETKSKILELKNSDPAGLEDAFYKNLEFGTGGLRGVMGVGTNRMNRYTVGMATQGLANYILKHAEGKDVSVCVSYDSRNNSELFAGSQLMSGAPTSCMSTYSMASGLLPSSVMPSARPVPSPA